MATLRKFINIEKAGILDPAVRDELLEGSGVAKIPTTGGWSILLYNPVNGEVLLISDFPDWFKPELERTRQGVDLLFEAYEKELLPLEDEYMQFIAETLAAAKAAALDETSEIVFIIQIVDVSDDDDARKQNAHLN